MYDQERDLRKMMRMLFFTGIASNSWGNLDDYKEFILKVSEEAGESTSADSKREIDSDSETSPQKQKKPRSAGSN